MTFTARFEQLNLRHLRYFLAVCDAGTFRGASAHLHVAQSAVSRRVADLERLFGLQLLTRTSRGIVPSDAGAALRDHARRIVGEIEAARDGLRSLGKGQNGLVKIGFFGTAWRLSFVPPLIARFGAAQPDVRLELVPFASGDIEQAEWSALDIGFFENEQVPPSSHVRRCCLAGAYGLALPVGHPLAAHAAIPLSMVAREELICFPRQANAVAHDNLIQRAALQGERLTIVHENESECSRLAFAASGMGLAIVSPLAANHDPSFAVEYRPFADAAPPFSLWMAAKSVGQLPIVGLAQAADAVFSHANLLFPSQ